MRRFLEWLNPLFDWTIFLAVWLGFAAFVVDAVLATFHVWRINHPGAPRWDFLFRW